MPITTFANNRSVSSTLKHYVLYSVVFLHSELFLKIQNLQAVDRACSANYERCLHGARHRKYMFNVDALNGF
jgi:hypothetical protein